MDESKIMRKSFTLVQQSITEFLRYFKQSIEIAILERRYKSASEMEQEMLRVHEAPSMYTLVTVESGSEQDFINILNEKGIESIYVNSDFLSDYNGSWIISIDDFEKLQKDAETLGILIEREKNEELEMEEDSYDERDISDEFSTEEDLEKEKEEEEKEIEESGYSNDSEIPVEDEIERKERKSQEKKEIKKGQIPVSVTSENFPYESDSYRTATEPVSEYDSSPRISEDIVIPVISEYNSEPVSESVTEPPVYETPSFQNPQMESVFSQETTAKPCDKYPETDSEQSVSGNSQDSYIGTHGQEIKNDATPCTRYNNPAREQPEQNQFSATTNIPESNEYEKRQESVTHTDYESGRSTESSYPESKPGIEYKQPEPVIPDVRTEIPVSRTSQTEQHPHESGDTYPSDFSNHDQYTSEFVSHHEEVKTPEPVFEKQSGMDTGAGSSTNGLERVPSSPITDHADFEYLHGEKKAPDPEKVDHFIQDPNKESGDQEYTQKEPVYEYQKQEELKKYPDSESDLRSRQYTDRILEVDDRQKEAGFHPTPEITKHSSEYEARSLEQKNQGVSFEQAPVSITHESENQEVPNKDKSLVTDFAQSNSSSFHSDQNPNYGFSRKQDSFSQSESYSKEDQKSETFTGPLKQAPTPKSVSPRTFDTEYKTDPKTDTTAPVSEKDPAFKIRDQFSSKKPEQKDSDVDRNLSFRPDHDQVSTESAKDSFLGNEGSAYIKGRDSGSKPAIDPIIKQKPEQDYKSQQGKEPFTDPLQSTEKHSGISSGIKNSDTQFAGSRDSAENKANLAPGAFKDSLRNVGSQDKISSSPSDNISKAGILNKATGTEKPDTKDLLSKDPLSLAKEKRDLDTKKSSDKDDDKLKLKATDITRVVYSGHHDSFNKAIFHAAFDSAAEETDFYKGTKTLRSQGLVDVARATSIFAAKTSLVKDVELLTRDLSPDQIKLLSKMIESGNYGIFDLDDPLKYKESMVSLHKFMRDNNMLQKRS
ncbi:MAG: hypothetical protein IJO13_01095, partial [Lachnospiraceae bacterium]|nr:hypothetical protein [Lachnospiraceae bacterium]